MGTRSVIAIETETGFKGRYVHWDGYPEHMVPEYFRLLKEKGYERCVDVLINWNAGWSNITSKPTLDPTTSDGRFKVVSNYGVAYTTKKMNFMGDPEYQQASFSQWVTSEDTESWCEWAYVLKPYGLDVWENAYEDGVSKWVLHQSLTLEDTWYIDSAGDPCDLPTSILV
jgi:hypothetical protein